MPVYTFSPFDKRQRGRIGKMGYMCDFCGDQRSMVYCRSDAASLCLSCDRNVHSANALSKRHSRTLLCERCNSQPAFVRYVEQRISLCHNCDWMSQGTSTSASISSQKRETINCYSGCPSAAELSSIWSFVSDSPTGGNSGCEQELGLMSISENSATNSWAPPQRKSKPDESIAPEVNDVQNLDSSSVWTSTMPGLSSMHLNVSQPAGSATSTPKSGCHRTGGPEFCEDAGLYEDFNMDEVDLTLENYEELFGNALNQSEELFENGGIDSLFGPKYMSGADSHSQNAVDPEGSTARLANLVQPACSNAASADSMMSSKTEPVHCFSSRPAHSTLSFSGLTESSAGDHQDCGASSMLLMGDPPWCPPGTESSFASDSRSSAVMRYKEKKKTRKFEKRVRYASRKARADIRKRVKGRFIKAGDAFDYDPLSETRSY